MSGKSSEEKQYSCPSCHGGHVALQRVAYLTWINGELITVPDFPAWICDLCGEREYDQRALTWLNIILSPDTGRKKHPVPYQISLPQRPPIQPDL
jgi:YgiT-type zinc finger domain-containing protein